MTHHIGYQTHHLPTGRYYIGIHSTEDLDDGYLGSGKHLRRAVRKHGRGEFRRHLVKVFATREEAEAWEAEIVTDAVVRDPRSFNLKTGGSAGVNGPEAIDRIKRALRKPAVKAKIAAVHVGAKRSPEAKAAMRDARRGREGRPHTAQSRARIGAAHKGRKPSAQCIAAGIAARTGKPLSDEHKTAATAWMRDPARKAAAYAARKEPVVVGDVRYDSGVEAANAWGVHPATIWRWVKTGRNGARRERAGK